MDEIKTLTAQLDVAEEKLETSRAQAEERLVFPFYLDLYKMLIFFIYFDINRFTSMKSTTALVTSRVDFSPKSSAELKKNCASVT